MNEVVLPITPQKYGKLLAKVRPMVIRTEEENERMLILVGQLMAKGDSLTPEEGELLRLLGKLIAGFEEEFYHIEDAAADVVPEHSEHEYLLRGQPIKYVDPTEPVWPEDLG
jgi:hypothetical protein